VCATSTALADFPRREEIPIYIKKKIFIGTFVNNYCKESMEFPKCFFFFGTPG
jgi:hypothetical protein